MDTIIAFGRSDTGLVIGDLTVDYCLTVDDGSAVSTAGLSMTELGNGMYSLHNANVTEDTIISVYVTADSSKYCESLFDYSTVKIDAILADTDDLTTSGVTLADGVTHGGTTAVLSLQKIVADNPAGIGMEVNGTTYGMKVSGADGLEINGTTGHGLVANGLDGHGILANGAAGSGLYLSGTDSDITLDGTGTASGNFLDVNALAAVNAEVDTALADYDGPTYTEMADAFAALNDPTAAAIADAVWDEDIRPSQHGIAFSAGKRLWTLTATAIHSGTIVSATDNTLTLTDDGSAAIDSEGAFDPAMVAIADGVGAGQTRMVLQYIGHDVNPEYPGLPAHTMVLDRDWKTNPEAGDTYVVLGHPGREHVNEGMARSGGANTITLNPNASDDPHAYTAQVIFLRSGHGQDQARRILAYDSATKVATVSRDWDTIPNATTGYVILPSGAISDNCIGRAVWADEYTDYVGVGTAAEALSLTKADTSAIVTDTDELQADWADGGRLDNLLDTAASASSTPEEIADAVWDEDVVGAHTEANKPITVLTDDLAHILSQFQTLLTRYRQAGIVTYTTGDASSPLSFYVGNAYDDVTFTLGQAFHTYLDDPTAEVWFTVKSKPSKKEPVLLNKELTIDDPDTGVVSGDFSGTDTDLPEGSYFWQIQITTNGPVRRVAQEGILYMRTTFKTV